MEASIEETADKRNLLLLVTLRWIAVVGQIVTILVVDFWLDIRLPLLPMGAIVLFLVGLNFANLYRSRGPARIANSELFFFLLLDVAALTLQLYLSGGASNPFVSLFLLQVILGAVLLRPLWSWALVAVTTGCFLLLTTYYQDIGLRSYQQIREYGRLGFFDPRISATFLCFVLAAVLLVLFVSRINGNIRERDRRLSELRQQSIEEEHIVRMGLLASGAAHELGTPLSTLAVIINDWARIPALKENPEITADIAEMRNAVGRCKETLSQILLAAGEARGENAERTTIVEFLDEVVAEWQESRAPKHLDYVARIDRNMGIVSDSVLRQVLFNVLDNALEASPDWIRVEASRRAEYLVVKIRDKGPGFAPEILANFGKPYQSTKQRSGRGLGLFLVVNVLRKLGGTILPKNNREGGASVELSLPIMALSVEDANCNAV
ncbi:MAG TPA: ATP-binding protein [Methylovirgula sp.]|nr:ATP-binding protein [Methylovirgula sp.]